MLVDTDPAAALAHARAAAARLPRIAAVREAVGVAAYHAGEYASALLELRAARRIDGSVHNLALMADAERGLGRPERAIDYLSDPGVSELDPAGRAELLIVVSGARRDMGQPDAAVVLLRPEATAKTAPRPWTPRLWYAYAEALLAAGRPVEALQWFTATAGIDEDETDAAERVYELTIGEDEDETSADAAAEIEADAPRTRVPVAGADITDEKITDRDTADEDVAGQDIVGEDSVGTGTLEVTGTEVTVGAAADEDIPGAGSAAPAAAPVVPAPVVPAAPVITDSDAAAGSTVASTPSDVPTTPDVPSVAEPSVADGGSRPSATDGGPDGAAALAGDVVADAGEVVGGTGDLGTAASGEGDDAPARTAAARDGDDVGRTEAGGTAPVAETETGGADLGAEDLAEDLDENVAAAADDHGEAGAASSGDDGAQSPAGPADAAAALQMVDAIDIDFLAAEDPTAMTPPVETPPECPPIPEIIFSDAPTGGERPGGGTPR